MNTNEHKFILGKELRQIVCCALEVLNIPGASLLEEPYENALSGEFKLREIPFLQLNHYDVIYKDLKTGLILNFINPHLKWEKLVL